MDESRAAKIKFMVGMILLTAVLVLIIGNFWSTVARQAELDRQNELQQQREEERTARTVIAVEQGDLLKSQVFVDMDSTQLVEAKVPREGIYNRSGVLIAGDVLEYGDIVKVYGTFSESEDGQRVHAEVTRMVRAGRARLETAEEYQKIADEGYTDGDKR